MSKKSYTKDEMVHLLTSLGAILSEHTGEFPGISAAVLALSKAAKDPTVTPESVKVAKKPGKAKPPKPVALDYSGDSLLVKNVPWGQMGLALKQAFNAIVGQKSKTVDPSTGEPYFKSCWDKKAKAFRLPKDKEAEVRTAIKDAGLAIAPTS